MKTPKRYQNKPTPTMPEDSEPDWYVIYCWCQRAKRKNRVKQLKRTIARLRWENFHMKIDLHIPVGISYDEYHSRRVDFTEKKPETYFD